jgi:CRISPR system Cascade subunit CasA
MNLLRDKWIPVRRRDGTILDIAPYEITTQIDDNPIVALVAPRPDFNGALIQFLVGLLQTVYAPKDQSQWEDMLVQPPAPEGIQGRTEKVAFAFEMFGDGPRFMQDTSLGRDSSQADVSALFIESPGENTEKFRKDFFVKRNQIKTISAETAAVALFCFQTNSPSGGQGHLTSLRGGGPLTTLVKLKDGNNSLWRDVWINVLTKHSFKTDFGDDDYPRIFLWTNPEIQEYLGKGKAATANLFHPYSAYWSYPRRILLNVTEAPSVCDVSNRTSDRSIKNYYTQTYGLNYGEGGWVHPLSPYYRMKDRLLPLHPQPGGILYDNWISITIARGEAGEGARVVKHFLEWRAPDIQTVIHAFGYDMDNMKARCWYESEIPFFHIPAEHLEKFEETISQMLTAAEQVKANLSNAVKNAWFSHGQSVRGDLGYVGSTFLKDTETTFYNYIQTIREAIKVGSTDFVSLKTDWLGHLNSTALRLFDSITESGSMEFENVQRIVQARQSLFFFNLGPSIKRALGLPVAEKPAKRSAKK